MLNDFDWWVVWMSTLFFIQLIVYVTLTIILIKRSKRGDYNER